MKYVTLIMAQVESITCIACLMYFESFLIRRNKMVMNLVQKVMNSLLLINTGYILYELGKEN